MAERKLLVSPDPDGSTFAKAFDRAARLPTEEDRKRAMEQTMRDVIREDLHRDALPAGVPTPTGDAKLRNTSGWANEIPICAPPGISLIDAMLPALSPQPTPTVNIAALRAFEPSVVRAKLEDACAKGLIKREQVDAVMSSLKPDAA